MIAYTVVMKFMDVWTLQLRPGVREEYASPAWLAALVIFIRLSSDGSYYGMLMSVRVSVRPTLRPSVRPGLRPPVFRIFLLHAFTH